MKFKVWERKLKEHMDIWYLATQDEELQMVSICIVAPGGERGVTEAISNVEMNTNSPTS